MAFQGKLIVINDSNQRIEFPVTGSTLSSSGTNLDFSFSGPSIVTDHLVGWWPFLNSTNDVALIVGGTTASDPAKDAILQGNISISTGLICDGDDGNYAVISALPNSPEFTLEAWINIDGSSQTHAYNIFFKKNFEQGLALRPNHKFVFGTDATCSDMLGATASLNEGNDDDISASTFHHLVVTFDGSNWVSYLDGAAFSYLGAATVCSTGSTDAYIGGFPKGVPYEGGASTSVSNGFFGTIRDVRFYDKALSSGEVSTNFTAGMTS